MGESTDGRVSVLKRDLDTGRERSGEHEAGRERRRGPQVGAAL